MEDSKLEYESFTGNWRERIKCYRNNIRRRGVNKLINKIISNIEKSLRERYWIDQIKLNPTKGRNNGKRVFIYESKATAMCLSKGIIHRNLETVCDEVKENLVSADTQLAETALIEAKAAEVQNPDNQPCYEQMIRLAEKAIEHAEKKKDKLPAVAITHYMEA